MNLYGLIGFPLGHSFSKQYFTEKFAREDLNNCYFEAFPISSIDQVPSLISANPDLKGLSVTIPYKEQVLSFVTELSEEVKQIGATNCIKVQDNKLIAFNTDIIGFEESFCRLLQPHHNKALVLGTGGASKAVQYVLRKLGIAFLVVTRTEDLNKRHINYHMVDENIMKEHTIIINCSPVGMSPNENASPDIPYQFINSSHYLYDLVYKPSKTLFLKQGEDKGASIQNGYDMLLMQAEASWQIWNCD